MISDSRTSELHSAAGLLLEARCTGSPLADLPEPLQPTSLEEAYFVQDAMARALEPEGVRSWKVELRRPTPRPSSGP